VIVGPKEALDTRKLYLRDVNWLGDGAIEDIPEDGLELFVKVRSTRPPMEAILYPCVFYEDQTEDTRVLGGGFIDRAEREASIETALDAMLQKSAAA